MPMPRSKSDGRRAGCDPISRIKNQAMLEAPDLKTRAEILIAVAEMDLAKRRTGGDPPLQ
jgi:Lon protease-like protein